MSPKKQKVRTRQQKIAQAKHRRRIANARKKYNERAEYMKDKSSRGGQTNGIRF
jgi:hypothetical protein